MHQALAVTLTVFVSALFVVPPAGAHSSAETRNSCPPPRVMFGYDHQQFVVAATLWARGCPPREHRQFPLWVSVARSDDAGVEGVTRGMLCGPFRPAGHRGGPRSSCAVDVALDHPSAEAASYSVEVTYPDDHGDQVVAFDTFCVSDGNGGTCTVPRR